MAALPRAVCSCLSVAVLLVAGFWPSGSLATSASLPVVAADAAHGKSVYLRLPRVTSSTPTGPLQILVTLHGMGGNGQAFAQNLFDQADRYGWLIVAPTVDYGNWQDPAQVAREDPSLITWLSHYLDELPANTGLSVRHKVLLLGHSRGAQLAHRFAEAQPDRVRAVAALSAGDYTLPLAATLQGQPLTFPFGVRDLTSYTGRPFDAAGVRRVQFWIGVGVNDTMSTDLPHQWDYEGTTRVQRAASFVDALRSLGASTTFTIFPSTGHGLTPEMRSAACTFLGKLPVDNPPTRRLRGSPVPVSD